MTTASSTPRRLPDNSKTVWWKILLTASAIFFIGGGVALIWWARDEPPPDISDLSFEPIQIPDEKNAYALLTKAALALPERNWTVEEEAQREEILKGKGWHPKIVEASLTDLNAAWPLIEKAVAVNQGQAPWLSDYADISPELKSIRLLSELAQIKALETSRAGNPDEALSILALMVIVGNRIEESRGGLFHIHSGAAIKTTSLQTIREILFDHRPSSDAIESTLGVISESRASATSMRLALHAELRPVQSAIKQVHAAGLASLGEQKLEPWITRWGRASLFNKPNQTLRIYSQFIRDSVAVIETPLSSPNAFKPIENIGHQISNRGHFTNFENIVGRVFLGTVTPTTFALLKNRLHIQSQISATQAILALHLYQRKHGEFSATLDLLVPTYLASVPRDYFDGAPIRYSRELGVVWSIGEKDLNITLPNQKIDVHEIAYYLAPMSPRAVTPEAN